MESMLDAETIKNSEFMYSATLNLSLMPHCRAKSTFPGVTDLAVNSRSFKAYIECVESAKALMQDIARDANNETGSTLSVTAEVNELFTGFEAKSKDWSPSEVARIWIISQADEENDVIRALGQARIFACEKTNQEVLTN